MYVQVTIAAVLVCAATTAVKQIARTSADLQLQQNGVSAEGTFNGDTASPPYVALLVFNNKEDDESVSTEDASDDSIEANNHTNGDHFPLDRELAGEPGTQKLVLRVWQSCGKKAAKECKKACSEAINDGCSSYKCKKKLKKSMKRNCKRKCEERFL